MRTMLLAAAASAVVATAAVPANAQVFFGADDYGAGVQVGPLGVGVGPRFDHGRYYYRDWDGAYAAGDCRVIKSKIVRPDGRVIFKTRRVCD